MVASWLLQLPLTPHSTNGVHACYNIRFAGSYVPTPTLLFPHRRQLTRAVTICVRFFILIAPYPSLPHHLCMIFHTHRTISAASAPLVYDFSYSSHLKRQKDATVQRPRPSLLHFITTASCRASSSCSISAIGFARSSASCLRTEASKSPPVSTSVDFAPMS